VQENGKGYLETNLTNNYSCFENKVSISQTTTTIDKSSPLTTIDIKLNNEDMSEYVTLDLIRAVQEYQDISYTLS